MRAGEASCACPECAVVCQGRYHGCSVVWARGPQPVGLVRMEGLAAAPVAKSGIANGANQPRPVQDSPPASAALTAKALDELRSDLRVVIDWMGSQQATQAQWGGALNAALAEVSKLASVSASLAVIAQEFQQEREAHLRATEAMVANLLRPLAQDWARTRSKVADIAAKVELLPEALSAAATTAPQAVGNEVLARLEGALLAALKATVGQALAERIPAAPVQDQRPLGDASSH